ncbi:uncharacterized protein LOC115345355 isoform X1 [Aquila chrysaetos chrysaetos]|uniref:uncharacterized protein LOC115345355 isoform X1 n=1 Tax=Aquila chrysaetos chrysaetos TaxID=223781 RepID=UPI0011771038|nr:uncharacterized protein LOC115345355 isoform X1 [Aquila chrysaetos chrysaetos]
MQTSRHHHSWEDEAPRLPHAARLGAGGGQERSLCCGTLPPVSPSPSFSSIFHSSCFLHKAGVSRDSSQMFSAAHHIAFLMKYSWSLSAFCHESLLQLPAMETLCRQHSCKATRPGLLTPRLPLGTFTPLLLPLPPPAGSAGAGGFVPPRHAADASPRVQPGPTCWGHRCPRAAVAHPEAGSVHGWGGGGGGVDTPAWGTEACHPTPAKTTPGAAEAEGLVCRHGPRAAAGSQPARSISDAVHYNPIRLFMQTIRFYVSVKSLNNLNQSKRPEIITGGGCGLLGGGQDTLPSSGHPAWLAPAAGGPGISWGVLSTESRVGDALLQPSLAARGSEPSGWHCRCRRCWCPSASRPASPSLVPRPGGGAGGRGPFARSHPLSEPVGAQHTCLLLPLTQGSLTETPEALIRQSNNRRREGCGGGWPWGAAGGCWGAGWLCRLGTGEHVSATATSGAPSSGC